MERTMSSEKIQTEQDLEKALKDLEDDVEALYKFKNFFFENHPLEMATEKNKLLKERVELVSEKFDLLDESDVPVNLRTKYLYTKGRCYNVVPAYDPRALECFSKAVKLNPNMVEAWNELGESYWKNMNFKESQECLEGSLKRQRHRVTLRSLSILLRQQAALTRNGREGKSMIIRSVDLAKEAVSLEPKDGISWSVLGNSYLCQYFAVEQLPQTLKSAMSAYKQAWADPIARGTPDLPYNKGVASYYEENYEEAMSSFELAHRLEPTWQPPLKQMTRNAEFLQYIDDLVHSKGRLKIKRLQQMVQSVDAKQYGQYAPGVPCTVNKREVCLQRLKIADMEEGLNEGKVTLGHVVGSYHSENTVPFTFAIIDDSMSCVAVNVYNWANGRGVIIGESVCIPEPTVSTHVQKDKFPDVVQTNESNNGKMKNTKSKSEKMYNFRTIRVNNPMSILINGRQPGANQYAGTRVSTILETH